MRWFSRLFLFLSVAFSAQAYSQNFDLQAGRMPLTELKGQFRFHAGDDPDGLLTDGVVEARNHQGELLGFERARTLSVHSAEKVAQAAQAFGQEDDITVLTLGLAPQAVLAI